MSTRYDLADPQAREAGIGAASKAIAGGSLVVIPTDTVYGLAADAFAPDAVQRLLDAKGRGREMPPPVLVAAAPTLHALASDVPDWARALVEELWPGPLTVVCRQQATLHWDLGETRGTVAVRMPDNEVALELLNRTGPLAVSSANLTGSPAALDAAEAEQMLGEAVAVILDGGPATGSVPSTIVDTTADQPRVLRVGAVSIERVNEILAEFDLEATGGDR